MKIAITLNDVVRDLRGSLLSIYDKTISVQEEEGYEHFNQADLTDIPLEDDPSLEDLDFQKNKIQRDYIDIPIELDVAYLSGRLKFSSLEEYISFVFENNSFEIFGRANLTYPSAMTDLNTLYSTLVRMGNEVVILSNENSNSKSGTLLFLAQNKCMANNFKFVSDYSLVWDVFDGIITADKSIYSNMPDGKDCIRILSEGVSLEGDFKGINLTLKQTIEYFKNFQHNS